MADPVGRVVWSGVLERRGQVAGLSGCAGTGSSLRAGVDLSSDDRVMTARESRQIAGQAAGSRLGAHRRAGGGRGRSSWRSGAVSSFAVGDE